MPATRTPGQRCSLRDDESVHDQPASLDARLAMITFLLDNGADPNIANGEGKTALDLATEDTVRALLIDHGAKGG